MSAQVLEYFTLGGVIDGLQLVVEQLFGVKMSLALVPAAESWAGKISFSPKCCLAVFGSS